MKINRWLKTAGMKAKTEGLIIAAQDQSFIIIIISCWQHGYP